jgi:hypothetical protein
MKILSFDGDKTLRLKRDPNQENLFNLFQKNIVINPKQNITLYSYVVQREYEMRLDKISNFLYGSPDYVEELMVINNIINPYSVKEGQYLYYCSFDNLQSFYTIDNMVEDTTSKEILTNSSKTNKKQENSDKLPLTIKPDNLKQITITEDNKVKIINSFE